MRREARCTSGIRDWRFRIRTRIESTTPSMNQASVSRSRKTRYVAPSLSVTSHSSRSQYFLRVLDPPATGRSPRTCIRVHPASAQSAAIAHDANRNAAVHAHTGGDRKAETADSKISGFGDLGIRGSSRIRRVIFRIPIPDPESRAKWLHLEHTRLPRIDGDRGTAAVFAHQRREPRHQRRELLGRRQRPCQQRELDDSAGRRIDGDDHAIDGRRRRMRFEIEQRQRPQRARVAHRRRQLQRSLVHLAASLLQMQADVQHRGTAIAPLEMR